MKIAARFLVLTFFITGLFSSCSKELSLEADGGLIGGGTAEGTLSSSSGQCANIEVFGVYGIGIPLTDSNYVEVEMNFTKSGDYYISTDTAHGIFFSKTSFVSTPGILRVKLYGAGVPNVEGVYPFNVSFKGSTCSFDLKIYPVAIPGTGDYFPSIIDDSWSYESNYSGASTDDTSLVLATNSNFTINSTTYRLFTTESQGVIDSSYFLRSNIEYHKYGDMDMGGYSDVPVLADYIYLKDNVPAGYEWETQEADAVVNMVPLKIKLKNTILGKDVNVRFDGDDKVYQNVVIVRTSEQVLLPTGWTEVLNYTSWYAKGIGLINLEAPAPVFGYRLTRYNVL